MLTLFRKRGPKAPKKPSPQWGDFRIVRTERTNGEVQFRIELYHAHSFREDARPTWDTPAFEMWGPRNCYHPTAEAAQAALDAWRATKRGEQIVSTEIIEVRPASSLTGGQP